jgi:hypothetical protein
MDKDQSNFVVVFVFVLTSIFHYETPGLQETPQGQRQRMAFPHPG